MRKAPVALSAGIACLVATMYFNLDTVMAFHRDATTAFSTYFGIHKVTYLYGESGSAIKAEGYVNTHGRHRAWNYYREDGTRSESVTYSDGKMQGPSTTWLSNGQKSKEGYYANGEREGPWVFWQEDGTVNQERSGIYKDGKKIAPLPKK